MGKGPMNENNNVYFKARKKAAVYNERLYSREGAAELLGILVSWLCLGAVLTPLAVQCAYAERGYAAFGGEWLTLPVILLGAEMARAVRGAFHEMLCYMEDADGAESNKRDRAGIQAERFRNQ